MESQAEAIVSGGESILVKLAEAAEQLLLMVAVDLHCNSSVLQAWVCASMEGKLSKGHCNISCLVALVPPDSLCIC